MKPPKFQSEAEEAKWWYDHSAELSEEFQQAFKEGRVKRVDPKEMLAKLKKGTEDGA